MDREKDDLLVRVADAQIEANRFRRKYEEVQAEYEQLRVNTGRLCMTSIIVGVIIGTVVGLAIGLIF